jgi:NhaP-type Na+/H+ or K+/H+ antiporter
VNIEAIAIVAAGFLVYGLLSGKLSRSILTGPMLFAAFGLAVGPAAFGFMSLELDHSVVHTLAEVTLVLVLFSDATNIDLKQLRADHNLPVRMLVVGMPIGIVITTGAALLLLGGLSLWEAALLAAILAPTDAALGQAVVSNPIVPARIRQALNVESGLNDGIALPLVLIFASLASATQAENSTVDWIQFGLLQVTLGPIAGLVVGYVSAHAVKYAYRRQWFAESAEGILVLAIAFLAFTSAELIGGNGFISAFVAGLGFGNTLARKYQFLYEFAESEGLLLILSTFFVFGSAMLPAALSQMSLLYVVLALLSLTVLRMLPVALSLLGSGVRPVTVGFLGWFGPRGLASVLFVLLILEELEMEGGETIFTAVVTTVTLSIVLHGVTAAPAARWYGKKLAGTGTSEEHKAVGMEPFANTNE